MSVTKLVEELSAAEIYEHMAYDMLDDEEFRKKIEKDIEMERQANMSKSERSQMLVNMFKSKAK
jgi:hypothetical protein